MPRGHRWPAQRADGSRGLRNARSPQRIETLSATGGGMIIGLGGALLFTGSAG
jgi:hypothetical protein